MAHHKRPAASTFHASNGESSRAAAARCPSDLLPQYAEIFEDPAKKPLTPGSSGEKCKLGKGEEREDVALQLASDAQSELNSAAGVQFLGIPIEDTGRQDLNALMDEFMSTYPPPPYSEHATGKLPCPVIIPQRRPRDWKRGFARAYAPVLAECGINQAMFLDFLKTFHAASKFSPWLHVVNLAAAGVGTLGFPIAFGIALGTFLAVDVTAEVQARTRTNSFLDRMNNEFFKPRGLYCLIMTYNPESNATHATVDITQSVNSSITASSSVIQRTLNSMRLSSGNTHSALEIPEAAPLIFPPPLDGGIRIPNPLKSSQKFVANYFDKRAQVKYASENPPKPLAVMAPEKLPYGEANRPANSGISFSCVPQTIFNPTQGGESSDATGINGPIGSVGRPEMADRRCRKGSRSFMQHVLYLMVVNLPTEAELAAVRASSPSRF